MLLWVDRVSIGTLAGLRLHSPIHRKLWCTVFWHHSSTASMNIFSHLCYYRSFVEFALTEPAIWWCSDSLNSAGISDNYILLSSAKCVERIFRMSTRVIFDFIPFLCTLLYWMRLWSINCSFSATHMRPSIVLMISVWYHPLLLWYNICIFWINVNKCTSRFGGLHDFSVHYVY